MIIGTTITNLACTFSSVAITYGNCASWY